MQLFLGLIIPFLGTALGSACVFFIKDELDIRIEKLLLGFASGVMIAASVWSLIIPAIEQSSSFGKFAFLPSAIGIALGFAFLLLIDTIIPHLHPVSDELEGTKSNLSNNILLVLAVTLHNIPEGMAVGVVLASFLNGTSVSYMQVIALTLGIALQNFPEGAIISLPLKVENKSNFMAFVIGSLTGIVEPIAGMVTILLSRYLIMTMPYLLAFAAGAMMYVVVEELIPEANMGKHSNIATIGFALGFIVMMILDTFFG